MLYYGSIRALNNLKLVDGKNQIDLSYNKLTVKYGIIFVNMQI